MTKNFSLLIIISALIIIAGCKKDTDNAAAWVGTYSSTGTVVDSINQVTIYEVNSTTVKILFQYTIAGYTYTYDTVQNATVQSANALSFNENDYVHISPGGTYLVAGSGTLSGNNIMLNGTARNNALPIPLIVYTFTGSK